MVTLLFLIDDCVSGHVKPLMTFSLKDIVHFHNALDFDFVNDKFLSAVIQGSHYYFCTASYLRRTYPTWQDSTKA